MQQESTTWNLDNFQPEQRSLKSCLFPDLDVAAIAVPCACTRACTLYLYLSPDASIRFKKPSNASWNPFLSEVCQCVDCDKTGSVLERDGINFLGGAKGEQDLGRFNTKLGPDRGGKTGERGYHKTTWHGWNIATNDKFRVNRPNIFYFIALRKRRRRMWTYILEQDNLFKGIMHRGQRHLQNAVMKSSSHGNTDS